MASGEIARPRTSTRDRGELRERLEHWVHFGEATLPADVDDMISHRRMLERMAAGEYWS